MAESQNTDLVTCRHEAVERRVAGSAEGDDELAQTAAEGSADQGVTGEHLDRALDRLGGGDSRVRIVLREASEGAL